MLEEYPRIDIFEFLMSTFPGNANLMRRSGSCGELPISNCALLHCDEADLDRVLIRYMTMEETLIASLEKRRR